MENGQILHEIYIKKQVQILELKSIFNKIENQINRFNTRLKCEEILVH